MDILGSAEFHLTGSNSINLDCYKLYGTNRKDIQVRAGTDSGGVGFLVRNEMCTLFDIKVLDSSSEGILWLKMKRKLNGFCIFTMCVYLPPEN